HPIRFTFRVWHQPSTGGNGHQKDSTLPLGEDCRKRLSIHVVSTEANGVLSICFCRYSSANARIDIPRIRNDSWAVLAVTVCHFRWVHSMAAEEREAGKTLGIGVASRCFHGRGPSVVYGGFRAWGDSALRGGFCRALVCCGS